MDTGSTPVCSTKESDKQQSCLMQYKSLNCLRALPNKMFKNKRIVLNERHACFLFGMYSETVAAMVYRKYKGRTSVIAGIYN